MYLIVETLSVCVMICVASMRRCSNEQSVSYSPVRKIACYHVGKELVHVTLNFM